MSVLICPHCKTSLIREESCYRCSNNHCFDIAKENYVNLLPVNSKKSKNPGDNKKMTMARRNFLLTDHYKPLVVNLSNTITSLLNGREKINILDIGCGEGYYTGHLYNLLPKQYQFTALDISKVAIRYASKRYREIEFCVASAYKLPVESNSLDIIYRIYAPSSEKEISRVLHKGGFLITVTPGERHLYQLRELIYDNVLNLSTKKDESKNLEFVGAERLHYTMDMASSQEVLDLLDMTPFGWKITPEKKEQLLNSKSWSIECDFNISVYRRV